MSRGRAVLKKKEKEKHTASDYLVLLNVFSFRGEVGRGSGVEKRAAASEVQIGPPPVDDDSDSDQEVLLCEVFLPSLLPLAFQDVI